MELKIIEDRKFTIPSLPPSCNSIYQIIFHQRRVEMKPEVRLWKTQAKEYIIKSSPDPNTDYFKIDVKFHYNFFYKNEKVKKFDTPNLLKVLIDAIAEKNGFDDSVVKFGSWESWHNPETDQVEVSVKQVKINE